MAEVEQHLAEHVEPGPEALLLTSPTGGPLYRGTFWPSRFAYIEGDYLPVTQLKKAVDTDGITARYIGQDRCRGERRTNSPAGRDSRYYSRRVAYFKGRPCSY